MDFAKHNEHKTRTTTISYNQIKNSANQLTNKIQSILLANQANVKGLVAPVIGLLCYNVDYLLILSTAIRLLYVDQLILQLNPNDQQQTNNNNYTDDKNNTTTTNNNNNDNGNKTNFLAADINNINREYLVEQIELSGVNIIVYDRYYQTIANRLLHESEQIHLIVEVNNDEEVIEKQKDFDLNSLSSVELWDYIAMKSGESTDDIVAGGWAQSYTGESFTSQEMDQWANSCFIKLQPYLSCETRVLEIGTSSGFTMRKIRPFVAKYVCTDLSAVAVQKLIQTAATCHWTNMEAYQVPANEIKKVFNNNEHFDLIIINSVVMYFPDYNYFEETMRAIQTLLNPDGRIFLGDLMDLDLKKNLVQSMRNYKQQHPTANTKLNWNSELFLSRQYIQSWLESYFPSATVQFSTKNIEAKNELSQYRYDAIISQHKNNNVNQETKLYNKIQKQIQFNEKGERIGAPLESSVFPRTAAAYILLAAFNPSCYINDNNPMTKITYFTVEKYKSKNHPSNTIQISCTFSLILCHLALHDNNESISVISGSKSLHDENVEYWENYCNSIDFYEIEESLSAQAQLFSFKFSIPPAIANISANALLLSCYALFNYLTTGSNNIAILVPYEICFPPFINLLPVVITLENLNQTLIQYLESIEQQLINHEQHSNISADRVAAFLKKKNRSLNIFFNSICNQQNSQILNQQLLSQFQFVFSYHHSKAQTGDEIEFTIESKYGEEYNLHWIKRFQLFLSTLFKSNQQTLLLSSIPTPLLPDEITIINEINNNIEKNILSAISTTNIPAEFQQSVEKYPNKIAVQMDDVSLTYSELHAKVSTLADHMLNELAIPCGSYICQCVERSIEMIVGILAILSAGCIYVPLNPSDPSDRLFSLIKDINCPVVFTQSTLMERLSVPSDCAIINLNSLNFGRKSRRKKSTIGCSAYFQKIIGQTKQQHSHLNSAEVATLMLNQWNNLPVQEKSLYNNQATTGLSVQLPLVPIDPNSIAYVIYTSGSTGQPKGAQLTHCGHLNLVKSFEKGVNDSSVVNSSFIRLYESSDRILQMAACTFDVHMIECIGTLITGATVVMMKPQGNLDIAYIIDTIKNSSITVLPTVPSYLYTLLDYIHHNKISMDSFHSLRYISLVGEALKLDLVESFYKLFDSCPLVNTYGPAECTDRVTATICPSQSRVQQYSVDHYYCMPIGHPMVNIQLFLVHPNSPTQLVIPGSIGLLCVTGVQILHSYYGQRELTEKVKFRLFNGEMAYNTGDLVKIDRKHNNQLLYMGRADFQVKIRGQRLEIGEVEYTIVQSNKAIKQCVVVKQIDENHNEYLVAYYSVNDSNSIKDFKAESQLKWSVYSYCKEKLQSYMIPAAQVILGKKCRKKWKESFPKYC
jgi:non-ribosomal peptide synthetase component F/2-polyprenyl-3-methyl-5-hydroxy-6-metoxy-1,4-benzoquinol methylase